MNMVAFGRLLLVVILFQLLTSSASAQDFSYFGDRSNSNLPPIVFQENFWRNPYYLINGEKATKDEVRAYMSQTTYKELTFERGARKIATGNAMNYAGTGILLGAFANVASTFPTTTLQDARLYMFTSLAGLGVSIIGSRQKRAGLLLTQDAVDQYNFTIRSGDQTEPFLSLRSENGFLGQRIRYYDGATPLTETRLLSMRSNFPELDYSLQKSSKFAKTARVFDVISALGTAAFVSYVLIPEFQSSAASNVIFPILMVDIVAVQLSQNFHRKARNSARIGLNEFNFRD